MSHELTEHWGLDGRWDRPAPEPNVAAWCAHTRNAFRDWEEHEMGMFADGPARDLGIVEWVVRVLGNPDVSDSRAVVEVLLARHGGTPDALAAEVERLRDELDQALAQRDDATNTLADIERASHGEA